MADLTIPQDELSTLALYAAGTAFNARYITSYMLIYQVLESLFFGVHSVLTGAVVYGFIRSGRRTGSKQWIRILCMLMYLIAAAHFGVSLWYFYGEHVYSQRMEAALADCIALLASGIPVPLGCDRAIFMTDEKAAFLMQQLETALLRLLVVNMALSDAIVIWRAWVLWPRRRAVQIVSILLIIGDISSLTYGTAVDTELLTSGLPGILLSWLTNVWSTTLISYKAWHHRRLMNGVRAPGASRTRVEKALLLFVESGLAYAFLWTFLAIAKCVVYAEVTGERAGSASTRLLAFMNSVDSTMVFVLVQLVSIYPTATVLLVERTDSYYNRTLALESVCTPCAPPPPPVDGAVEHSGDSDAEKQSLGADLADERISGPVCRLAMPATMRCESESWDSALRTSSSVDTV